MAQSHYSLRWNNHQSHILSAFDALLQAETLVDVTLVCAETSVRAHKVVLSACSPFFQRIFSENPCKHPVIVLKDFHGWEVQAIVDFMYKGEISVGQEQLQNLIKAAESLQVRGLAHQDPLGGAVPPPNAHQPMLPAVGPPSSLPDKERSPTPAGSPGGSASELGRFPTPGTTARSLAERTSPFSPLPGPPHHYEPPLKLPHMAQPAFGVDLGGPRHDCTSPLPRRKQARPRRRSGELCGAQDLSKPPASPAHADDAAENLCMKRGPAAGPGAGGGGIGSLGACGPKEAPPAHLPPPPVPGGGPPLHAPPPAPHPLPPPPPQLKSEASEPGSPPELDLSMPDKEYAPSPPLGLPAVLGLHPDHHLDSHSPLPFPPMPSVSALAMTPPHIFGLDSPLGLFPPGLDGCRNPLLDMTDPRTTPDTQLFSKKKIGRPKGQHSAPRGGPPRSWTNAELTEALQHVWNKKMTTSQASRIFGIPYNSLLMYVRGKYGKSLKLEQLRKDCIGGPGGALDLLNLGAAAAAAAANNNNNNNTSNHHHHQSQGQSQQSQQSPHHNQQSNKGGDPDGLGPRGPGPDDLPPPMFNPFAPNFYPDFGAGFPIPVSMIHLLPQSEKNREPEDECGGKVGERSKEPEDEAELFRAPPLLHNGQD